MSLLDGVLCCIALSVSVHTGYGISSTGKRSYVAVSNSNVTLSCISETGKPVRWSYLDTPTKIPLMIYNGIGFDKRVSADKFSVVFNTATGRSYFTINNTQPSDGGTYSCSERENAAQRLLLELVVLYSEPECSANFKQNVAPVHSVVNCIEAGCSLNFTGNLPAVVKCSSSPELPEKFVYNHVTRGHTNYRVTLTVSSTVTGSVDVTCVTSFHSSADRRDNLTQITAYEHVWTSSSISVNRYGISSIGKRSFVAMTNSNATLSCRSETGKPVRWSYLDTPTRIPLMIYNGISFDKRASIDKFSVGFNTATGRSDFTINHVQPSDGGTYSCLEFDNAAQRILLELVVLHYEPECYANLTQNLRPVQSAVDCIDAGCDVNFTGNLIAVVQCSSSPELPEEVVYNHVTKGHTDYRVKMTVSTTETVNVKVVKVTCVTSFQSFYSVNSSTETRDNITQSTAYEYPWTSTPISINIEQATQTTERHDLIQDGAASFTIIILTSAVLLLIVVLAVSVFITVLLARAVLRKRHAIANSSDSRNAGSEMRTRSGRYELIDIGLTISAVADNYASLNDNVMVSETDVVAEHEVEYVGGTSYEDLGTMRVQPPQIQQQQTQQQQQATSSTIDRERQDSRMVHDELLPLRKRGISLPTLAVDANQSTLMSRTMC